MTCTAHMPCSSVGVAFDKPKGQDFINELTWLGFELTAFVGYRLFTGDYVSYSVYKHTLTVELFGYEPIVIYKTLYTAENTSYLDLGACKNILIKEKSPNVKLVSGPGRSSIPANLNNA